MIRINIPSNDVKSVGYDREARILEVELSTAGILQYHRVPEKVYAGLLNAKSYVVYFIRNIKYTYPYKRIV